MSREFAVRRLGYRNLRYDNPVRPEEVCWRGALLILRVDQLLIEKMARRKLECG